MTSLFTFKDFRNLYRLASIRNRSKENYFEFQKLQGELLVRFLESNHVMVNHAKLLDLGCGFGGYTSALKDAGARVTGVDFHAIKTKDAIPMVSGDGLLLPFANSSFEIVICASLIEHVPDPESLVIETLRVLKPGGYLYLSFPPFFSPVGGHQFSPFHLLGERLAISLSRKKKIYKLSPWIEETEKSPTSYSLAYGNWGLYPVTINQVKKVLHTLPVKLLKQATRYIPIDISKIPLLGEFLTWHVQFICRKI